MNEFFIALLTASLAMSAVILVMLALNRPLAAKASAKLRYYLWLVVLIGLLIPFRPSVSLPFEPISIPVPFAQALPAVPTISEAVAPESAAAPDNIAAQDIANAESGPAFAAAAVREAAPPFPAALIPFGVWTLGVLGILCFQLYAHVKFVSAVRRWGAEPGEARVQFILRAAQHDLRIPERRIAVKVCELVSSPMLIGFFRPAILLPDKALSSDELAYIFRHELVHYKRGDLWVNLLTLLAKAMHWFNPVVYIAAKTIRADCEAACDEIVVQGNSAERRRRYGETIIGFIGPKRANTPALSTYFYGGGKEMKKRLTSIMDTGRKSKGMAVASAVLVAALTILSTSAIAATSNTAEYIGESKAQSIALGHAKVAESNATFLKIHLDHDDGRVVYDVEFYSGNTEYDYEIDAISGDIREYDKDIEYYSIPRSTSKPSSGGSRRATPKPSSDQYLGDAKAKSIALEHAKIAESNATFLKIHLDHDDGRVVYDVEFYSGNTEYDYEIDAISGDIREYDKDIEYYSIPKRTPRPSSSGGGRATPKPSGNTDQYIGEARAKSIALSAAGLSESDVRAFKAQLDREDGIMVYEVDFKSGRMEYEYEIHATSGDILKADEEYDD